MSLRIEQRETEGVIILDLHGSLAIGEGEVELRDKLAALRHAGSVNVVLNLKHLSHLDSTGLGTLVIGLARLRKADGKLALLNVNQSHMELFSLTKLALAFEFFDDEHDAVNSFFPDRAIQHFDILEFVQQEEAHKADEAALSERQSLIEST